MSSLPESTEAAVNWRRVGLFLGTTFGLTYLLDLLLKLSGGLAIPSAAGFLQLQMMLPAFVAIILGMFVFKDSAFHVRRPMAGGGRDRARGFFYLYMTLTLAFAILVAASTLTRGHERLIGGMKQVILVAEVLGLLLFRVLGGRDSFARANLRGARLRDWVIYGGSIVIFLGVQAALNALFHLGETIDVRRLMPHGLPLPAPLFLVVAGVQTIVLGSLIGLPVAFGEEYGWRGFLQGHLVRLGKKRGVLIVGLIWGAWHYPMIWMGFNYPGYPVAGTLMMTLFTVLLAYVFGYALLKTGSIWLVAFMHAIVDQTTAYIVTMVEKPDNPLLSFGIGLYGLAMLAVIVLLLLRDPIWKDAPAPVPADARP